MTTVVVIYCLVFIIIVLVLAMLVNGKIAGGHRTISDYHNHVNDPAKRQEAREAEINSHYAARLKRAWNRGDSVGWMHLRQMADQEIALDKRMHTHSAKPKSMPKGIKFNKDGHVEGGIGRAGTKHSHARNPPNILRPKKKSERAGKAKSKIKNAIIGDMSTVIRRKK